MIALLFRIGALVAFWVGLILGCIAILLGALLCVALLRYCLDGIGEAL